MKNRFFPDDFGGWIPFEIDKISSFQGIREQRVQVKRADDQPHCPAVSQM